MYRLRLAFLVTTIVFCSAVLLLAQSPTTPSENTGPATTDGEKARFIPGKHVALDGFYKRPDGTVSTMPNDEFYEFD